MATQDLEQFRAQIEKLTLPAHLRHQRGLKPLIQEVKVENDQVTMIGYAVCEKRGECHTQDASFVIATNQEEPHWVFVP